MEKDFLEIKREMWEIKTEIKYLTENLKELKEINKLVVSLMERQNTFSDRVSKLENDELKEVKDMIKANSEKLRKLEDWKLTLVASAWVVGAIASFILNKFF